MTALAVIAFFALSFALMGPVGILVASLVICGVGELVWQSFKK